MYGMMVFLSIDGRFELLEIVVLANFYDTYSQKLKKSCYVKY